MFNLDAKKVEYALGTKEFLFLGGQEIRKHCVRCVPTFNIKKSENIVYVVFPPLTLRNQKTLCTLCSRF